MEYYECIVYKEGRPRWRMITDSIDEACELQASEEKLGRRVVISDVFWNEEARDYETS